MINPSMDLSINGCENACGKMDRPTEDGPKLRWEMENGQTKSNHKSIITEPDAYFSSINFMNIGLDMGSALT